MRRIMHAPARIRIIVIFTLALVLAGCFSMGCTAPAEVREQNDTRNGTDLGFRPPATPVAGGAVSFKEATAALADLIPGGGNLSVSNASQESRILYARGTDLDVNGNAASWILVVRSNNRTYMVATGQSGSTLQEWKGAFPREEIRLDSVLPPADLFRKNSPEIFRNITDNRTVSRDLVLSVNTYTLTLSGGGERRILVFDAATGALMKSNG